MTLLMSECDDFQLLREYAQRGSQAAFGELVRRYIDLIYSSAVRQVGDPHAAEDVTQTVFIVLTRKAGQIKPAWVLSAWLLGVTRFAAKDHLKRARRRRHYEHAAAVERTAVMVSAQDQASVACDCGAVAARAGADGQSQKQLSIVLDEAMAKLSGSARDAMILRFFENKSFRQVGQRLGVSELAARQRVFRGVEKQMC
jgi:RNA polymerase sigma factor (sigma-70 family)